MTRPHDFDSSHDSYDRKRQDKDDDDNDEDSSSSLSSSFSSCGSSSSSVSENDEEEATCRPPLVGTETTDQTFVEKKVPVRLRHNATTTTTKSSRSFLPTIITTTSLHHRKLQAKSVAPGYDDKNSDPDSPDTMWWRTKDDNEKEGHSKRRRRKHKPSTEDLWWSWVDGIATWLDRKCPLTRLYSVCSRLFWVCFVVWALLVVLQQVLLPQPSISADQKASRRANRVHVLTRQQVHDRLQEEESGTEHFWNDVGEGLLDWTRSKHHRPNRPGPKEKNKKEPKEADLPGCVRDEWQSLSFPTCNDVHDMDTVDIFVQSQKHLKEPPNGRRRPLRHRKRVNQLPSNSTKMLPLPFLDPQDELFRRIATSNNASNTVAPQKLGYIGSGLWRSVWTVNPRFTHELVVLKSMKREHDVDARNLDRHRRDALVMERLTASPNIVSIMGYCGTSVVSEYIPTTLESIVKHQKSGFGSEATQSEHRSERRTTLTRDTEEGRLALSLQVAKGLYSIHRQFPSSPIVHADLTVDQFLVSSTGQVKLNDFNRCRFMAHKATNSSQLCSFVIPTSPGKARSPEEYAEKKLDQQIDVYSTANVLYMILTGEHPWHGFTSLETKQMVQKGTKPKLPELLPNSTDRWLARLIERAYDVNPRTRITAQQLVQELERIQEQATRTEKARKSGEQ